LRCPRRALSLTQATCSRTYGVEVIPRDWSDEGMVRRALGVLLSKNSIELRPDWLSVRIVHAPNMHNSKYVIVMAYPPAKAALFRELDEITHQMESMKSGVGIWVLSEKEAQVLCERNLPYA